MKYVSTRGRAPELSFCDVLLAGLATDGGLYLPAHYPPISGDELTRWRGLSYADLAAAVIGKFVDDIPGETLLELCRRTYTAAVYGNARPDSEHPRHHAAALARTRPRPARAVQRSDARPMRRLGKRRCMSSVLL